MQRQNSRRNFESFSFIIVWGDLKMRDKKQYFPKKLKFVLTTVGA